MFTGQVRVAAVRVLIGSSIPHLVAITRETKWTILYTLVPQAHRHLVRSITMFITIINYIITTITVLAKIAKMQETTPLLPILIK